MYKRLLIMKRLFVVAVITAITLCCTKEDPATTSTIETVSITDITETSAVASGNIVDDGNSIISQIGVCWSEKGAPSLSDYKTELNIKTGNFTCTLTALNPNTKYYIRAYSLNAVGISYGNLLEFKTLPQEPSILTKEVEYITPISAVSGGSVINSNNGQIDQKGVCWSTNTNPTISDSRTLDGNVIVDFVSSLTGTTPTSKWLSPRTKYYVRAYVIISEKVFYGNEVSFTTPEGPPTVTDINGVIYRTVRIGNQIWMAENLKTTRYKNGQDINKVVPVYNYTKADKGVYCEYENKSSNSAYYGFMYNFLAIADPRGICPEGWHLPTYSDMNTMINSLGGPFLAYPKVKDVGLMHWKENNFATNESGFTALPGGMFWSNGSFSGIGEFCSGWWTADISPLTQTALCMYIYNREVEVYFHSSFGKDKEYFNYVRCVKDDLVVGD